MTFKPYGITPPIITPFHPDGSVDYETLAMMSRHLVENGVHVFSRWVRPANSTL